MIRTLLAIVATTLGALVFVPGVATANSVNSVTIQCEPANLCESYPPAGLSHNWINWSVSATNVIIPYNCGNRNWCYFYCPKNKTSWASVTVTYLLNGVVVGSASAQTRCQFDLE